jgi:ABC-type thiamine transport system ATPase subunit
LYLLDDIFSSLDAHVADAVFGEVICKMLVNRHKTVMLVTSHYKYLHSEAAERLIGERKNIIYIDDGKIVK